MTLAELSLRRPVTAVMFFVSMVVDRPDRRVPAAAGAVSGVQRAVRVRQHAVCRVRPRRKSSAASPGPSRRRWPTLPGIKSMNSTSRAGRCRHLHRMFSDWDRDIAITASEARDRIDAIRSELPDDLQRYFVQKFSPNDEPLMRVRFSSNRDLTDRVRPDRARSVQKRIERIPGVARVDITGAPPNEVEIAIDPMRLGAHNVGLNELAGEAAGGQFLGLGRRYQRRRAPHAGTAGRRNQEPRRAAQPAAERQQA